jgi:F0F1-type ATP synthase assembly protein I
MLLGRRAFSREGAPIVLLGPRGGRRLTTLTRLASVGIEFSLSTVVGLLGGRWLDGKLGTAPWLMIVGLLLGVTAGMRSLLRAARSASANQQSQSNEQEGEETRRPP